MSLTALDISRRIAKDLTPKKYSDGGGMYLHRTPGGSLVWRMKYRVAGKEKLATFGQYPHMSLAEARDERDRFKIALREHRDPMDEKKKEREAAAVVAEAEAEIAIETFGKFAREVIAQQLPRQKEATRKKWELHMGYAIAKFGTRPIA